MKTEKKLSSLAIVAKFARSLYSPSETFKKQEIRDVHLTFHNNHPALNATLQRHLRRLVQLWYLKRVGCGRYAVTLKLLRVKDFSTIKRND